MVRSSTRQTASRYSRSTTPSANSRDTRARTESSSPEVSQARVAGRPGSKLASRLTDPDLYVTDPYPLYKKLRAEAPVAWNEERGFWAVSRHADVIEAETDAQTYCASRGILTDEIG